MKRFYPIAIIFLPILVSLLLFSCGDLPEEETEEKTLESISISPASATLEVGNTQSFSASAHYTDNSSASINPSWSVSGGIGTINLAGYTGLFTATAEGTGSVIASYSGKSDSATVYVTTPTNGVGILTTLEVSPSTLIARVGGSQIFTAQGTDISGDAVSILPIWEISGDDIGVLTSYETIATLEAIAEGTATISCTSGEVVGYSYVTIEGYVVEITVEADTYVDEANPADTHWSDTSLKAGYVSSTDRHYETYLRFPLDLIPDGASVESVTLMVYPSSAGSSALQLKKLDSNFSDSTTWESRPAIGSFIVSGVYTAGDYNNVSDDNLTSLVRDWKSGASVNCGLALVQEGAEDGIVVILSLDNGSNPPLLKVEYKN